MVRKLGLFFYGSFGRVDLEKSMVGVVVNGRMDGVMSLVVVRYGKE